MNKIHLTLVATMLFVACEDSTKDTSDSSLEVSLKKWQSHVFTSYRMNMDISCFCIPAPNIDVRVKNGEIALINGENFTDDELKNKFWHAQTVDNLFKIIENNLSRNPHKKRLKFNETYGYPEEIYFDIDEMMADDEVEYLVHSFSPINDGCIDESKISDSPCIEVYDPVCGCDGATYSNSCKALVAGVTSWTSGICK
ncbi:MAG: DUF6174 domain-containing protein [Candidatus Neomarinimicrobiota bacterium]|nr:DUF6174 domain-containing protein [Candidatus Neomarinimicrobiota bacterium]